MGTTALLAALAYQFGRRYIVAYYDHFGIDADLLNLSSQEFIQRSLNPLFPVFGLLMACGFTILFAYRVVDMILEQIISHQIKRTLGWLITTMGLIIFTPGLMAALIRTPYADTFGLPLSPGVGAMLMLYGLHLRQRTKPEQYRTANHGILVTYRWLAIGFVIWSLFWTVNESAAEAGGARALYISDRLSTLPSVTVLSQQSLVIRQPGVTEERITTPDSAYSFKYNGLRLLSEGDGTFFLIPNEWSKTNGAALPLKSNEKLRLEFRNVS